jgi:hypothetical protein
VTVAELDQAQVADARLEVQLTRLDIREVSVPLEPELLPRQPGVQVVPYEEAPVGHRGASADAGQLGGQFLLGALLRLERAELRAPPCLTLQSRGVVAEVPSAVPALLQVGALLAEGPSRSGFAAAAPPVDGAFHGSSSQVRS